LFLSCRAAIRAHIAVARAKVGGNHGCQQPDEARVLLEAAITHLGPRKPRLVAIGGVSGTGKSTLAYGLAPLLDPPPGAIVVRSDVTRKALLGVAETTRLPVEAYTPAMHVRVFSAMAAHAALVLNSGYSAILDGVYGDPASRHRIAQVAGEAKVPFDAFWLQAPGDVLSERIRFRRLDASDATEEVLRQQLKTLTGPDDWIALDGGQEPGRVLESACRQLIGTGYPLTESGKKPI